MTKRLVIYDELEDGRMLSYESEKEGCISVKVKNHVCFVTFTDREPIALTDYFCVVDLIPVEV